MLRFAIPLACPLIVLLAGCGPAPEPMGSPERDPMQAAIDEFMAVTNAPRPAGDYAGWEPLSGDLEHAPIKVDRDLFMEIGGNLLKRDQAAAARSGRFMMRLFINADGTVKNVAFLYGHRDKWKIWNSTVLDLKFIASPEALPGPWEMDATIVTSRNLTRFYSLAYRNAAQ